MPLTAPLPTYLRIAETICRDIAAGRLADGDRLPPERDMAASRGIAVGTLRKALAELETRGLLERRHGSGNYIRAGHQPQGIYALFRLELLGGGGLPTAQVLSVERTDKPDHLPAFGKGTQAHRIRRLRHLSGQPASVEEIWLCASFAQRMDRAALSESLYHHYRQHLGLNITRAEDRIGQEPLPDWTPAAFPHPAGTPMPQVLRLSQTADGQVAEISRNWFDPGVARYVARL
ncbi:MAG: GntR family transcriptional regulator [Paracoccus sp. (in: a-proteobacteria)]|uniref:GntR family transcriptional regulator n=1 Tax=Paracoccus sp. TaxID=267 RepID=UPI0026DF6896|nr:GntR family transcriptional regulator [Paracoccus sp. (in: a-proteobacteria)]MDO5613389.1 GntR family transcriptional regulator [Paracoccus sp. (in: a-proteobacteria)]